MKILFAASEAVPLIKTGGLADVSGSLPIALRAQGADVRLIMPAYETALAKLDGVEEIARFDLPPGAQSVRLLEARLQPHGLPVILVQHEGSFDRPGNPYQQANGQDWPDNGERFGLFCRAITAIATGRAAIDWIPDILHCNDWQTGLVPALLANEAMRPRILFTIHNLAYQGTFGKGGFERLQLPWELWRMEALEYHGSCSFMKGGIAFADHITTVSPTYAREVLTPLGGHGLDGALQARAGQLSGVLNGIDYEVWNPAGDPYIKQHYDAERFALKAKNKAALQKILGLKQSAKAMLFGHIGRMVYQKGVDLITDILPRLMELPNTQVAVLGSGLHELEHNISTAATTYLGRVGVKIGYDEGLSHLIEAGCDAFLMPSRFEPCGLNQMYSLRYGTVPIVHRVGGLADTVVDATPETLADGTASGFVLDRPDAAALWEAVERAHGLFSRPDDAWRQLAIHGMRQDFSWARSAADYLDLYRALQ